MEIGLIERWIEDADRAHRALTHIDSLLSHLVLRRLTTDEKRAPAEGFSAAPGDSVEHLELP